MPGMTMPDQPGGAGGGQDLVAVGVELLHVQVAVGVDQGRGGGPGSLRSLRRALLVAHV